MYSYTIAILLLLSSQTANSAMSIVGGKSTKDTPMLSDFSLQLQTATIRTAKSEKTKTTSKAHKSEKAKAKSAIK